MRNVLWDRHKANTLRMFRIYHIPLLKVLYFTMPNNNDTDSDKYAQYKVKSQSYKWLLLTTENLFKKFFLAISGKDATTLRISLKFRQKLYVYLKLINWTFSLHLYHSMNRSHKFRNTDFFFPSNDSPRVFKPENTRLQVFLMASKSLIQINSFLH